MSKSPNVIGRNRVNIYRPAWEVGSNGQSIGGENSINRSKQIRAYSSQI